MLALLSGAVLVACSGAEEADGAPEYGELSAFPSRAPGMGTPGGTEGAPSGGASPAGGPQQSGSGDGSPASAPQGMQTGSTPPSAPQGTPAGSAPPAGSSSDAPAEGNPNGAPLDGNANNAGGAMAPGAGGAGSMPAGSGTTGEGTSLPPPATTPPPGSAPPPAGTPPAGPDIPCPPGAIFCSGFEGTGFPEGTRFEPDYLAANALGTEMTLDDTVFHSGRQSLKMPVGHNYYRMLSVAVPASFWVRLYARSSVGLGAVGSTHATFFMGSIVPPGGDYNADRAVEIAEQFGQILLNVKDSLFGTSGINPNGQQPGTRLPDNAWSCMEAQFDGPTGDIHVFVEGNEIIDASGWQSPIAFQSFRFGYLRYDSPARDVWMDDVVVAPNRVGCQ